MIIANNTSQRIVDNNGYKPLNMKNSSTSTQSKVRLLVSDFPTMTTIKEKTEKKINYTKISVNTTTSKNSFTPSSIIRKITTLFFQLFSPLREIQKHFTPVQGMSYEELNKQFTNDNYEIHENIRTQLQLHTNSPLNAENMTVIKKILNPKSCFVFQDFFQSTISKQAMSTIKLPPIDSNKIIFFPIVVKKLFIDHIVLMAVSPGSKTIEFYDSKGLTIKDQQSASLRNYDGTLLQLANKVVSTYATSEGWSILENTKLHQMDRYNCGVFVAKFMLERSERRSFLEIVSQSPSFETVTAWRTELIDRIAMLNEQLSLKTPQSNEHQYPLHEWCDSDEI